MRQCGDWLQWLLTEGLAQAVCSAQPAVGLSRPRVILVDGTSLGQTGGTGDDWRVQLAYDRVEGRLVDVQIGDRKFAETLVGLPGRPGDLFVGDRGYGKRDTVIALARMQAAAFLRFSPNHCRLEQADGSLLEVSRWLDGLEEAIQIGEQEGYGVQGTERVKVPVLALRLPPEEAEKARLPSACPCSTQAASRAAGDVATGWLDPVDFARWMHTTFPLRNCSGCIAIAGRLSCSSNR